MMSLICYSCEIIISMINFLLLTVPTGTTYEGLKHKLQFPEDVYGVSNWVMKFPLTIYSADLTEKHVFMEGTVDVSKCAPPNLQERWRYFIMTKSDSTRWYCTSHVFYEKSPILKKQTSSFVSRNKYAHSYTEFYVPKCLIFISDKPYFKVQINLIKIYRQLRTNSQQISHEVNCWLYDNYQRLALQGKEDQWQKIDIKPQGRSFICPIEVAFNYYLDACNTHLHGESIYLNKENKTQILHLYRLPESSLYQINYFFHLPISGTTLLSALSAILQEKQIIFTSYNQNSNVMLMETLLSLILPLKWHYLYVPNLPIEMIEAAQQCFMPMIVGIHKKHLHHITNRKDKVIIHVDTNKVEGTENLADIPAQIYSYFHGLTSCSPNKSYVEWQKDMRVCSIMMIASLLSDIFFLTKKETVKLMEKKLKAERKFYEQFTTQSMMFHKLKEDLDDPIYKETVLLLKKGLREREEMIYGKYNQIMMDIARPAMHDQEKEWIRFYYTHNEKRKQFKDFKKSLIFDYSVSSTNQSQATSINSSFKKLEIGGKKIGFTHSTVRL